MTKRCLFKKSANLNQIVISLKKIFEAIFTYLAWNHNYMLMLSNTQLIKSIS